MKYQNFEDIPVWQESREFVNQFYKLVLSNKKLRSDFSLVDQLKRAVLSIMLNIAEGFERGSNKEFANFLNISKGSAGEVRSILYILLDNAYIADQLFIELKQSVLNISTHLCNFRLYLLKHPEFRK